MNKKVRRVIVAGSKNFADYDFLRRKLDEYFGSSFENVEIVSGHADGADKFGELYAAQKGLPCRIFPAEWQKYGRKAVPIRNSQMLKYALESCPEVIAFWNGTSSGTFDTIKKAAANNIKCTVYLCIPSDSPLKYKTS